MTFIEKDICYHIFAIPSTRTSYPVSPFERKKDKSFHQTIFGLSRKRAESTQTFLQKKARSQI